MSSMTFGLTLLLVGMGGTLATLWLITLLIRLMTSLFPPPPPRPHHHEHRGPGTHQP